MRVKQMLLDGDEITYTIGGVKFRYLLENKPALKVGQEVEFTELIRKTRPYLIMSKETQKQMEG
ncbi:hypothetical protein [Ligilactobacillus salivarius]|uniref:hypothetical protein n=1 Tax=Ligilactobacillus salivarius TaxID=1624 RepID=UPI00136E544A|nr:hypothetical protein [Ligilactobacillus salivarius]MYY55282.1 hypothetical protein [Ligilactobacillus salivarius]